MNAALITLCLCLHGCASIPISSPLPRPDIYITLYHYEW